jgi:hypothetical protein
VRPELIINAGLIVTAAGAALLCDFLRARNAQLRHKIDRLTFKAVRRTRPSTTRTRVRAAQERPTDLTLPGINLPMPTGMHSLAVLSNFIESRNPFTGLVVSIGVTMKRSGDPRTEDLASVVQEFIAGLLRDRDFGCRIDQQEFLLLCPGLRAQAAEQHLRSISERLWDYQLRALTKIPLIFSMGGSETGVEGLSDAIASAQQRMDQTMANTKAPGANGSLTQRGLVSLSAR